MSGCRPLTVREIDKIISSLSASHVDQRNRCLVLLGLYTGFRISELLSLRVGDVIQSCVVRDRVKVERANMKGKKTSRSVVLNEGARRALAQWLAVLYRWRDNKPDLYLFQSQKGGHISRRQAARIIGNLAQKLGLPPNVGTHSMRKTFAQKIYEMACASWRPGQHPPIHIVQAALGHSSVDVTERYLGLDVKKVDNAVAGINYGVNT